MRTDYKHRAQNSSYANNRRHTKKPANKFWRWLLVVVLVGAFVFFLNMIRQIAPELIATKPGEQKSQQTDKIRQEVPVKALIPVVEPEKKTEEPQPAKPEEPRYDFYTILPKAEIVVPDYEIKTRVREELVGKIKASKYMMQAGSFRIAAEAENQKAKLAQLGIQSKVETAKVGNVIWHRVKIGPYDNPSSVATIKELLQKNGFGVIVTEGGQ